jgi:hypothetical protein
MKGLFRLLKIVPYEYISDKIADVVSSEKAFRAEKRATALDSIKELENSITPAQVMKIMEHLQIDLDNSYAREQLLVDFITKIKE